MEIGIEQEPGSGGKESAEYTLNNLPDYYVFLDRPTGSKEIRAEPFAAMSMPNEGEQFGQVKIVKGAWNTRYINILRSFPYGAIKDPVDASSGAYNHIADPLPAFL